MVYVQNSGGDVCLLRRVPAVLVIVTAALVFMFNGLASFIEGNRDTKTITVSVLWQQEAAAFVLWENNTFTHT